MQSLNSRFRRATAPAQAPADARGASPRRDPAPSRTAYRLHRLWLTPLFRALMRVGVPAFVLVFGIGLYFSDDEHRANLGAVFTDMRTAIEDRPEFMVSQLKIEGASQEVANALRALVPVELPASSFDLDLDALQAALESFDAVASAELQVRAGGILQVTVQQRRPALVWRSRKALELLDAKGHRVASIADRAARADLPLVAGDGADKAAPEALLILATAASFNPRLRGLVRMGERRWDIVLDNNQRILLPEDNPVQALEWVLAHNQTRDLFARNILLVDMRNQHRPTVRLAPAPLVDPENVIEASAGASTP